MKRLAGIAILAIASIANAHEVVPGEYLVKLKSDYGSSSKIQAFVKSNGAEQVLDRWVLVKQSPLIVQDYAINALKSSPAVELVEPNYVLRATKLSNDPEMAKLWGIKNVGGRDRSGTAGVVGVDVNAEKAWDVTTGSRDVVVAVIDTGVDFKIDDLKNNAWVNIKEANGKPGVDDDGNGYIDDINGYDFANSDADPTDDNGHGSHCAGTIGGEGDNGVGVVGVSWQVSIMGVKFLTGSGSGTLANAVKSIKYAADNGAHIMSNSWGGGGFTQTMKDAIEYARAKNILFVAAAGNDGANNDRSPTYPANYDVDNVISVAAVNIGGNLASFSNYGLTSVDIAAPGVNVYSTTPTGNQYLSGTSMATPHVSGVAALVLSANKGMTYTELRQRLIRNSKPLAALKGKVVSGGLVDAYYALTGGTPPPDENDPANFPNTENISVESPHPYSDSFSQTYVVHVPGATKLSVYFDKFDTEDGYDFVVFKNANGDEVGSWSGDHTGAYSPVVEGDKIIMEFTTDTSTTGYGFSASKAVYQK